METLKSTRRLKGASISTVELTDELYDELSVGQQFVAKVAEGLGITVQLGEYEGRYFVHRETIEAADTKLFAPAEAKVTA